MIKKTKIKKNNIWSVWLFYQHTEMPRSKHYIQTFEHHNNQFHLIDLFNLGDFWRFFMNVTAVLWTNMNYIQIMKMNLFCLIHYKDELFRKRVNYEYSQIWFWIIWKLFDLIWLQQRDPKLDKIPFSVDRTPFWSIHQMWNTYIYRVYGWSKRNGKAYATSSFWLFHVWSIRNVMSSDKQTNRKYKKSI